MDENKEKPHAHARVRVPPSVRQIFPLYSQDKEEENGRLRETKNNQFDGACCCYM